MEKSPEVLAIEELIREIKQLSYNISRLEFPIQDVIKALNKISKD